MGMALSSGSRNGHTVRLALKAKFYFLSPAFPMLLAAGAVPAEQWFSRRRQSWLKPAYVGLVALTGALLAPMTLPALPPHLAVRYCAIFGGDAGVKTEQHEEAELPQHFADQFGWETMVAGIAEVYEGLSPEDRAVCTIFCSNYGEAAAVDFYGPPYGLPPAISGHNTYYLWGPGDYDGQVAIAVIHPAELEGFSEWFDTVEVAGQNECDLCIPYERGRLFCVCRGLKAPIDEVWPQVKSFG